MYYIKGYNSIFSSRESVYVKENPVHEPDENKFIEGFHHINVEIVLFESVIDVHGVNRPSAIA